MTAPHRPETPLATLRQTVGRLPLLLRHMEPTWFMGSVAELTPEFVVEHGVTGIIWDVDGTLTAYHETALLPEAALALSALRALPGVAHAILSNAPEWRFRELASMFPDVPVLRGYRLGAGVRMRQRLGQADSWSEAELAEQLAAGAVPLRKPNADLVRLTASAIDRPVGEVVMVGDQFLTDVAGARLAGARSIKLSNPAPRTFPPSIRFTQRLEAILYHLIGRKRRGRTP